MRTRRVLLVLTLVIGAMSTASTAVAALPCPDGVGLLGSSDLTAGVCVPDEESTGSPADGTGSNDTESSGTTGESPYQWARTYPDKYPAAIRTTIDPTTGLPVTLDGPAPTCTGPSGEVGRPYRDTLTDTRNGEVVSSSTGCELPGEAGVTSAPPPAPSAAEVVAEAPLPKLPFMLSPSGRNCSPASASPGPANPAAGCAAGEAPGLTGLEMLLWIDPPPPPEVSVTVAIRGYTVTTRAHPVRYQWDMRQPGDTESIRNPSPRFTTDGPGTRDAPAARYKWETKGDYRIALSVVWEGSYTFSGFGVVPHRGSRPGDRRALDHPLPRHRNPGGTGRRVRAVTPDQPARSWLGVPPASLRCELPVPGGRS